MGEVRSLIFAGSMPINCSRVLRNVHYNVYYKLKRCRGEIDSSVNYIFIARRNLVARHAVNISGGRRRSSRNIGARDSQAIYTRRNSDRR